MGRIEVKNHPRGFAYLGTGWLVDENIIVTNRHVAREFATFDNGNFIFASNPITNRIIKPHIDFVEEYRDPDEAEINIDDILYIDSDLDIAFLKLKGGNAAVRPIIPLASTPPDSGCEVAVIGYPAADSHRNPLEPAKMRKIFADIYDVKRLQPGTITAVIDGQPIFHHDCSTLGGNSGSPVLNIKTGEAVGLHFAGDFKKQNYAISASIVKQKLEALQAGTLEIVSLDQTPLIIFPSPVDVEEVDNETPIEFEDIPCLCPLDVQSLENSSLEGPFSAVNTQLPKRGTGYYSYARYRDKQFGLPETIQAIEAIGEAWFQNHRRGPLIGIGNISVEGGGPVPPHKSHQKGLDIDFRPLRKDGARVAVTFKSASYSRSRTQELVNTILTNPVLSVELIFFNDRKVKGVQHWPGHDNHLHVRFTK
ncbi:MAG: penicillin-insensitive murein endopeptidase [Spirulina sp.]